MTNSLALILIMSSSGMLSRDLQPPIEVTSQSDCPKGLRVVPTVIGEKVNFRIWVEPDAIEGVGLLYKGRVSSRCQLHVRYGGEVVVRTDVEGRSVQPSLKKAERPAHLQYRFEIARAAAESSSIRVTTSLHEKDGSYTFGGGKTLIVQLAGFLPPSDSQ